MKNIRIEYGFHASIAISSEKLIDAKHNIIQCAVIFILYKTFYQITCKSFNVYKYGILKQKYKYFTLNAQFDKCFHEFDNSFETELWIVFSILDCFLMAI